MTVEKRDSESKITYKKTSLEEGDEFNITYPYLEDDGYITVVVRDENNTLIPLVLNDDYEIEEADGTNGVYGIVRILKERENIDSICFYRSIDISQEKIFDSQTIFSGTVESALDKLTMIVQDQQSINRTIHVQKDDIVDADTLELPTASERANGIPYFDSIGNLIVRPLEEATKSLRQPAGEEPDPSFEIPQTLRANKLLGFNDSGGVKFLDISSDINPTKTTLPSNAKWRSICYGNGLFVVIDSSSPEEYPTSLVAYSWDGEDWKRSDLPSALEWTSVCFGNGRFVAVCSDYDIAAYSNNGIGWGASDMPQSNKWRSVCYGNDKFVAIASSGIVAYSENGSAWTLAGDGTLPLQIMNDKWTCVCYGNNKFVAVGLSTVNMGYSNDGITWTAGGFLPKIDRWRSVCYGNDKFVAIASSGIVAYSWNGEDWNSSFLPQLAEWSSICYGNGLFVVIASDSKILAYSEDGIEWKITDMPISADWTSVCYGNQRFVAIANNSDISCVLKTSALTWSVATKTTLGGIKVGDGLNITEDGTLSTSEYSLPIATADTLGGIKIGDNLSITDDGKLSATAVNIDIVDNLSDTSTDKALSANMGKTLNETKQDKLTAGDGIIIEKSGNNTVIKDKALRFPNQGYTLPASPDRANTVFTFDGAGNVSLEHLWFFDNWRCIRTHDEESTTDLNLVLPLPDERKGKVIGFADNNGKQLEMKDIPPIYELPVATADTLGGIKIGDNLSITDDGKLSATAVNIDIVDNLSDTSTNKALSANMGKVLNDKIEGMSPEYNLPIASETTLGCVQIGEGMCVVPDGARSGLLDLLPATADTLGGIKIGTGFKRDEYGVTNVDIVDTLTDTSIDKALSANIGKTLNDKIEELPTDSIPVNWKIGILPTFVNWQSVCYGNGTFVAVSNSHLAAYSTDGINWTQSTLPALVNWRSVCYGNGIFVAVVYNSNQAAYSTDGATWTSVTLPASAFWQSVCYGNGTFVAVANNSNLAAYSTDGIEWEVTALPASAFWYSVCYGNGKFVAVCPNSNLAAYSIDGVEWEVTALPTTAFWSAVCYGSGIFVAVVYNGNQAAYSLDGENWSLTALPATVSWQSVCYGNGTFVAVAENSNQAAYSTDGATWTSVTLPASAFWQSVCYGNKKFISVANNNYRAAYCSVLGLISSHYPVGSVVFFVNQNFPDAAYGTWESEFVEALNVWKFTRVS